ncbi:hypothetical protein [Arboricoccus pini]|uniref:hypothetical protein n=1 Tax=Arboricoccus pini TaxID=1963835 RepID=UPI0013FDF26A|nr:hypothetical protein [Arboricoccus pini]
MNVAPTTSTHAARRCRPYAHGANRRRVAKRLAGGVAVEHVAELEGVSVGTITDLLSDLAFKALLDHYRALARAGDALREHRLRRIVLILFVSAVRRLDPLAIIYGMAKLLALRDPVACLLDPFLAAMERGMGSLVPRRLVHSPRVLKPAPAALPTDPVLLLRHEGNGERSETRLVARLVRLAEAAALMAASKGRHRRGAALIEEADILLPLPPEDELGDILRGAWVALRRDWLQRSPKRPPPESGPEPLRAAHPAPPQVRPRHRFTYQAVTAFDP